MMMLRGADRDSKVMLVLTVKMLET